MQRLVKNLGKFALGGVAFLTGSAMNPAEAGAHCGGHGNSCGWSSANYGNYCDGRYLHETHDVYWNDCSGTCYNGGTSGCCASPEACADEPCKPGGCGGACGYAWTEDYQIGEC